MARDHPFGIAAIAGRADEGLIAAQLEQSLTALLTLVAMTAQPTYANPLANRPAGGHTCAQLDNATDHLMTRYAVRLQRRVCALDVGRIRAANAAGLDSDQHFACARFGNGTLDHL